MRGVLTDLPAGRLAARAGAVAVAVWLVALLVLSPVVALLLGNAGAQWNDPTAEVGVVLMLAGVGAVACGLGAAVGVWQAATAGAQSRREAVLAGASAPVALTVIFTVALAEASVRGIVAASVSIALAALGAAFGGLSVARRLDG